MSGSNGSNEPLAICPIRPRGVPESSCLCDNQKYEPNTPENVIICAYLVVWPNRPLSGIPRQHMSSKRASFGVGPDPLWMAGFLLEILQYFIEKSSHRKNPGYGIFTAL